MDTRGSNLVTVNGVQHHDTALNRLWGLVQSKEKVDFRMDVGGRVLQAHRLILELFLRPEQLLDVGSQYSQGSSLDFLLQFVYLGTVGVPEEQLDTLLELARQLDFTMLVNALLGAKDSIQVSRASAPPPDLRNTIGKSSNNTPCASDVTSTPTATSIPTNSTESVNHTSIDWVPVVPKLEPVSDDDAPSNNSVKPQSVDQRPVGVQQSLGRSTAPEVDGGSEYNVHMSSVSVTIKEEPCSEVKLENFGSEDSQASSAADHCEIIDASLPESESQKNMDELRCSQTESSDDEESDNSKSSDDESIGELYEEISSTHSNILNVALDSDNHVEDVDSTEEGEESDDSEPVELSGEVGSSKPAADSDDVKVLLKKRKRDLYKMLSTSKTSEKKKHKKKNKKSKKKSKKKTKDRTAESANASGASTDTIKRFQCCFCEKGYNRHSYYLNHFRTHTGETPFKCQVCDKEFHTEGGLGRHSSIHTGERPFGCKLCPMTFRLEAGLRRHNKMHTGEKPFKCLWCKKNFQSRRTLAVHFRTHTGEKPFKCQLCEMEFNNSGSLSLHIRRHTGEKPHVCGVCQKAFRSKSNLNNHARVHSDERAYKCSLCEMRFWDIRTLTNHSRTHNRVKPYKCEFCEMEFNQRKALKIHTRIHTGGKKYKCLVCQQRFGNVIYLNSHSCTNPGGKPNKCEQCGMEFSQRRMLKTHMKLHTGEKVYQCDVCLMAFTQSTSLKRHLTIHSREKDAQAPDVPESV